ncbi:hypothetical protein ACH3O9_11150 [Leeuwenhoekiella sp. A16]|uniref:hypothetical protein n=1 Tax=Leeuwenhoekiella sp. A16 TaxID=3141462 RepID=UPI003A7FD869
MLQIIFNTLEETIVDRLMSIPKREGISKNQLEREIGKTSGYLNVLKKKGSLPGIEVLQNFISIYPKYSLRWILSGEGPELEIECGRYPMRIAENDDDYTVDTKKTERDDLFKALIIDVLKDQDVQNVIKKITLQH